MDIELAKNVRVMFTKTFGESSISWSEKGSLVISNRHNEIFFIVKSLKAPTVFPKKNQTAKVYFKGTKKPFIVNEDYDMHIFKRTFALLESYKDGMILYIVSRLNG